MGGTTSADIELNKSSFAANFEIVIPRKIIGI